ncbi:cation efflux family protein [Mycobacterium xenopi 4042]|uniref:Cation efflux family protein n=1 Tax=Mycobacterium xenopi 4042 TaxID=1299334 RepID=X8BG54_MYCXE|nr:cation efflux family protein [Mycobacterium xenopi 4042]
MSADADRKWLATALGLIVAFMGVEVVIGVVANSLALISDAGHMLTDAASIMLALIAIRLADRPARAATPTVSSGWRSCRHRPTGSHCCC